MNMKKMKQIDISRFEAGLLLIFFHFIAAIKFILCLVQISQPFVQKVRPFMKNLPFLQKV